MPPTSAHHQLSGITPPFSDVRKRGIMVFQTSADRMIGAMTITRIAVIKTPFIVKVT
jgi:hypothetical protein